MKHLHRNWGKKTCLLLSFFLITLIFTVGAAPAAGLSDDNDFEYPEDSFFDDYYDSDGEIDWSEFDFIEEDPFDYEGGYTPVLHYAKGTVLEILEVEHNIFYGAGISGDYQKLIVRADTAPYKGQNFTVENSTSGNPAFDLWAEPGDKILLVIEESPDGINAYIGDYARDTYVYILAVAFFALLIIIGRLKGLKSVVSLLLTLLIIAKFLLPLLLAGKPAVPLTLLTGFMVTVITFVIISGFSRKTLAAVAGTTGGLVAAAIIAIVVGHLAHLKGMYSEEAQYLLFSLNEVQLDFRGLLFSGIMIGALGAVMDVCMSIASSLEEIGVVAGEPLSYKQLFTSGMNIGKDIMGTMSNTLILAYTGSSLALLLLFMSYEQPFMKLINLEMLAAEMIRALSGSLALVLSIPITAAVGALIMHTKRDSE